MDRCKKAKNQTTRYKMNVDLIVRLVGMEKTKVKRVSNITLKRARELFKFNEEKIEMARAVKFDGWHWQIVEWLKKEVKQ